MRPLPDLNNFTYDLSDPPGCFPLAIIILLAIALIVALSQVI